MENEHQEVELKEHHLEAGYYDIFLIKFSYN